MLLLVGAFVLVRRLERSWIGLNLDALRLDETAASCFGLDIVRWKITAFLIGNFLIGIAGALFGMVGGFVAPNNYTFADSLILVSILLLGGIGNPWGLMVATFIVVVVPEKLQTIQEYRFLLYALMVIARAVVPAGRFAAAPGAPLFSGMAAMTTLLEARGLVQRFGGVLALDGLDLAVASNEILGLIGPNGSGKTTFFNVVTGIYGADDGRVTFDGVDITKASARAVYLAGISRTFQRSRLSLPLSIFDNIMIGNHKRLNQGLWFNLIRRGDFKREFEESYRPRARLVEVFEPALADRLFEPVAGLPMIDRRRIEICRALISAPKLLLLDEPSAGMTHDETAELMNDILLVRERNKNLTIIIVEHEMGVIERITDRCVVLNFGRKIAEGPYRDGCRRRASARSLSRSSMMAACSRSKACTRPMTRPTYCKASRSPVEPGSITCLLGSNGSGKTTLVRSILGLTPPRAGRIVFNGTDITRLPTHKIIAAGIACIPEGRKVFPKLTVEENLRVGAYQETSDKVTQARLGRYLADFPAACRAPNAARRHDVGRRAGDGIDRTRPDVRAQAAADRRAFARPVAAAGEGEFQHHPPDQRARHYRAFGRAERTSDARDLAPRLCSVERARGGERHAVRACIPPGRARCLFRVGHAVIGRTDAGTHSLQDRQSAWRRAGLRRASGLIA